MSFGLSFAAPALAPTLFSSSPLECMGGSRQGYIHVADRSRRSVLFLCTHNSARSQMAEGLLRDYGGGEVEVHSAGTVATQVRDEAIQVMAEAGIDISRQTSKTLEPFVEERFDYVITVCDSAQESCPIFPNAAHRWHWSVDDPSSVHGSAQQRLEAFRRARNELDARIQAELLPELRLARSDRR